MNIPTGEPIKTILVEDDRKARKLLRNMLLRMPCQFEIQGETGKIEEALQMISIHQPQLLFLDIALEDGTAFDLLEKVGEIDFEIIFTTGFDHYAVQAFQFSALHYLLKPVDEEELENAVERFIKTRQHDLSTSALQVGMLLENLRRPHPVRLAVREATGIRFLRVEEVVRCEAEGNYTQIHLGNGSVVLSAKSLKEYEQLLEEEGFFRVHHSHLINMGKVEQYKSGRGGHVRMEGGALVEVAVRKKEEFLKRFGTL